MFGESVLTMIYVVRVAQESLLGLNAGKKLGIILIMLEGPKKEEGVRETQTVKRIVKK